MSIQKEFNEREFYKKGLNPEEEFLNRQEILNIEKALQTLPEDLRLVLLLREQYGLRYEEIAKALSLNLGTVKNRIFRAREKLRKLLMQQGEGGMDSGV
jgi:RNA polymerase sigma-70 factor (ECF subfamily)